MIIIGNTKIESGITLNNSSFVVYLELTHWFPVHL